LRFQSIGVNRSDMARDHAARLPRTVWALGLVSLFMDASSESIHALLPLFLTVSLGASAATVGLIDGIAEAVASITKMVSGYLSDRVGRRKPLVLIGYGLAALSKPLFPLASSATTVFVARFADRIGKGLRGAPRDALVADITPPEMRGRAFGLRQALDTAGAFIGPLAAIALMAAFADNMRLVFWVAAIPALLAVLCVLVGVEDPRVPAEKTSRALLRRADLDRLNGDFWGVIVLAVAFMLARFSEAFLILKASAVGLPLVWAPLALVVMNVVYALGSYPAGVWADRAPAQRLLAVGFGCLIAADFVLAWAVSIAGAFVGIALWGAHMALSQGLLAKLVAEHAPAELRGSAFGLFNLTTGLAALAASVTAGVLWDWRGAQAAFLAGAVFAGLALLLVCRFAAKRN
jgi:MFS family permease